jgi:hypothetical protein
MCERYQYAKTKKFVRFRGRFSLNKNLVFSHQYRANILLVLEESNYMIVQLSKGECYKFTWIQDSNYKLIASLTSHTSQLGQLHSSVKIKQKWTSTKCSDTCQKPKCSSSCQCSIGRAVLTLTPPPPSLRRGVNHMYK